MKNDDWLRADGYDQAQVGQYSYAPQVKHPERKRGRFFNWLFQVVSEAEEAAPAYPIDEAALLPKKTEDPLQAQRIQQALKAWQESIAYFENVSDPALIDYAVYDMEAAQKRYMFLLRSARDAEWPEDTHARVRTYK